MKPSICLRLWSASFAVLLPILAPQVQADEVTVLTREHTDLLVQYDASRTPPLWMGARTTAVYDPTNVLLTVAESSKLPVPANASFAFLGAPGDPVWILPASQNQNLLYLGFASDAGGPALGSETSVRITRLSGPGKFFIWQTSGGQPQVFCNTAPSDSVDQTNRVAVPNPGHLHFNFGFSTSGVFRVSFRPESTLTTGGSVTGTNSLFVFHVAPLNAFETWQTNHWSPTAPESIVAAGADPDGDGVVNAAEFAMGLDPNIADRTELPQALTVEVDGQTYGAVRYRRAKTAIGTTLVVEARDTLSETTGVPLTEVVGVEDLGTIERTTVRDTQPLVSGGHRFYTIRVVGP